MKVSSNSNIFATGLFALSFVILFSSCTKESVEPVTQTSITTSSERKMIKVENTFSNINSNEFSITPGEQPIEPENTDVTPYTNNLSGKKQTSGGNGQEFIQKENTISERNTEANQTNFNPYNSVKFKKRLIPSKL